jgi:hypothetical protein
MKKNVGVGGEGRAAGNSTRSTILFILHPSAFILSAVAIRG